MLLIGVDKGRLDYNFAMGIEKRCSFALPFGTQVRAARDGLVWGVELKYDENKKGDARGI